MTISDSQQPATEHRYAVPESAWVLGWLFLAEQAIRLALDGVGENNVILVSAIISALLVAWFSYGVLTARPVRGMIVLVLMWLASIALAITFLTDPSIANLGALAVTVVQLIALLAFRKTPYFAWQRTRPHRNVAGLEPLIWMAVVVGVLGGIIGSGGGGLGLTLNF
ncbi:MAG: hypothetical protein ACJ72L_06305 [Marmoricola sp.]